MMQVLIANYYYVIIVSLGKATFTAENHKLKQMYFSID